MAVTSARGLLSLLDEPNLMLQVYGLRKLNLIVDSLWHEVAESVTKIESLYEDTGFPERKWAALIASKVYYHLGSYEDALMFALGAGELFNVNEVDNLYVDTIIAKCIDYYIKLRNSNAECGPSGQQQTIDPRLEDIVQRMFDRCFAHKQLKQAIGIALESRRFDILVCAIKESDDTAQMLKYCMKTVMDVVQNRQYRNELLRCLTQLYMTLPQPDFITTCQCLIYLEDPQGVADILEKLAKKSEESALTTFQIAFDLYESASQQYIAKILQYLRQRAPIAISSFLDVAGTSAAPAADESTQVTTESQEQGAVGSVSSDATSASQSATTEEKMDTDVQPTKSSEPETDLVSPKESDVSSLSEHAKKLSLGDLNQSERQLQEIIEKLVKILGGSETINIHTQFLIKNNKTDMLILKNIKDAVRNNICHTAAVVANGFMHGGTTCDDFLRDNLEWVSRATNWSKFSAVASLGVIHKGHETDSLRLLESYLPKESATPTSGYMEGGGLYALGLIHANHGNLVINYLKNQLQASGSSPESVRHGGCLGLGLAAMGSHRNDVYDQLRSCLFTDDAVVGEAAAIAMGLVNLGSKDSGAIQDMVAYAQETQHEKILRGLCLGIALTMYGRQEEAETLIDSLCRDKAHPILRRSGVYTIALAYCGTGDTKAIRQLLHIAVNDVNDDVKRAAITSLGFLLFRRPEECVGLVSLSTESYNPHVRCGAALAVGIACAGTGNRDAVSVLDPLVNDPVNFVRQAALIALSFVLIQHNEVTCPKVKEFRTTLMKVINDKHEDNIAKFGAIMAQGILDAGGRNVTISLMSRNGHMNMEAVVGVLVFLQYWFWFPLSHFLSLAFTPTCLIGLNCDLKMPKIEFRSGAKPSMFAYPPPIEEKKDKSAEKVETAVLSITAKAKKKDKDKLKTEEKMDTAPAPSTETKDKVPVDRPAVEGEQEAEKTETKEKEKPEPLFELLENPARVMKAQLKYITMNDASRYQPLKSLTHGGITLLMDKQADQPAEFVEHVAAGGSIKSDDEKEPEPPEPFEWTDDAPAVSTPSK